MAKGFPSLSLFVRVFITCLAVAGLGLASRAFSYGHGQDTVAIREVDPVPTGTVGAALSVDAPTENMEPEVLVRLPLPGPTSVPVTPTSLPTEAPTPRWAQAEVDTPLRIGPEPGAAAEQFVPKQSYVRLLTSQGSPLRIYYAGNGDEHKPGEGWVDSGDLAFGSAPRWVEARHGTLLWSSEVGDDRAGSLPEGAVAEVLEDRGKRLRVFYLGNGFSRDVAEGWADVADLGPAGPLLVSERYGLRILTKADVDAINAGHGVWLRVPFRTQLDGSPSAEANCGPTSVAMALQYFRLPVPTGDVRNLADKLQGTSDPDGGFQIEFLEGAVERFGLKGLDLGPGAELLKRWTLDDVRRHLSLGHPVIAQLRYKAMPGRESSTYDADHYVVLTGVLGDDFVYNDSIDVDGPGYGRVMSSKELDQAWGTSYFPFAGFAVSTP